jgi:hypothetical protein
MPSEAEAGAGVVVTSFPVFRLVDDGFPVELVVLIGKSVREEVRRGDGFRDLSGIAKVGFDLRKRRRVLAAPLENLPGVHPQPFRGFPP